MAILIWWLFKTTVFMV